MKLQLILLACLALSLPTTRIDAQDARTGGVQDKVTEADPATGIKKRLGQLKTQFKELRAKPHALKPGEAVGLNPQPEPPGKARSETVNSKGEEVSLNPQPEPPGSAPDILRKMRSSLASVQADFDKLSLSSATRTRLAAKLDEARAALSSYEKAGDRKTSNVALDDFSHALDAVSKLAGSYVQ